MKASICMVGQFPPPVHGLSKALQTIVDSQLAERYELRCVNITRNTTILRTVARLRADRSDCYYFTIAQSIGGNLRDLMLLRLMLGKGKPVIIHLHSGFYGTLFEQMWPLQKRLNQRLVGRVDMGIVLGESLRGLLAEVLPAERVRVVENCVDRESLLDDAAFAARLGRWREGPLRILYLSNLQPGKGYMTLLRAAALLRERGVTGLRVTFAGYAYKAADGEALRAAIEARGLENWVEYLGPVYGAEKLALLESSHVFVLPTSLGEGQPLSILEAMGNGLAIITTRRGGIPDIVGAENGWFVEPEEPEALADRLAPLAADREALLPMAERNRAKVLDGFLEADYLARMERVFAEALALQPARERP